MGALFFVCVYCSFLTDCVFVQIHFFVLVWISPLKMILFFLCWGVRLCSVQIMLPPYEKSCRYYSIERTIRSRQEASAEVKRIRMLSSHFVCNPLDHEKELKSNRWYIQLLSKQRLDGHVLPATACCDNILHGSSEGGPSTPRLRGSSIDEEESMLSSTERSQENVFDQLLREHGCHPIPTDPYEFVLLQQTQ